MGLAQQLGFFSEMQSFTIHFFWASTFLESESYIALFRNKSNIVWAMAFLEPKY